VSELPKELKACAGGLTVQDPWAQAIVFGPKRIENRSKQPPSKVVGERIAVQTGKSVDHEAFTLSADSPFTNEGGMPIEFLPSRKLHHPGHIIGTVRVVGYTDASGDELAHATMVDEAIREMCNETLEVLE